MGILDDIHGDHRDPVPHPPHAFKEVVVVDSKGRHSYGYFLSFTHLVVMNLLVLMGFVALLTGVTVFATPSVSRPAALETRGLNTHYARLSPRSFLNDTAGHANVTATVINGTAVVTLTETVGVQETLTSLATVIETIDAEETETITISDVVGAEAASAITITEVQTIVLTTQVIETIDGAEETYTIGSTNYVTFTEVIRSGVLSTVTHYVEPYPVSKATHVVSDIQESEAGVPSDYTSTETLTKTLTVTDAESSSSHHETSESASASEISHGHDEDEMSSTTTLTSTPTVTITHATVTTTPVPISVEAFTTSSTQVGVEHTVDVTETIRSDNVIFVTETIEPVCGTEEAHYVTVTETVYHDKQQPSSFAEPESVTPDIVDQPGEPTMTSSEPEVLTITSTGLSTSTLSFWTTIYLTRGGPAASTSDSDVDEASSTVTRISTDTQKVTQVITKTETQTHTHTDLESPEVEVVTVTSLVTVTESDVVAVPAQTTITQSVDVDLNEQLSTVTVTDMETESVVVEEAVSTITEVAATETRYHRLTVTDYETQVLTEIVTRKIFTTGSAAEVRETVVTDTILHTELVTVTRTRGSEEVTAVPDEDTSSSFVASASRSTVSAVLANVGNGTYHAPSATVTYVEVAGGRKLAGSRESGATLGIVVAAIGLMALL